MTSADVLPLGPAIYFDGRVSTRRTVSLEAGQGLEIREGDTVIASWPFADVRRISSPPDRLVLHAQGAPELARLEVHDATARAAILARCTSLDGPGARNESGSLKIVAWSLAAAISLALVIVFLIPILADKLTPFIPAAVERRLGAAADQQMRQLVGAQVCVDPAGVAALNVLARRLQEDGSGQQSPEIEVWASPIVNAFALPGGQVRVFRGLLEQTRSVDEFAGVLAHELGHVRHRDGLRNLLRSAGSGYLLGLFFGDISGAGVLIGTGKMVLDASYSREAESEADGFALESLSRLGRPAVPMGEFLVRVAGGQNLGPFSLLASHPSSEERLERLRRATAAGGAPLLDESQWNALRNMCKSR